MVFGGTLGLDIELCVRIVIVKNSHLAQYMKYHLFPHINPQKIELAPTQNIHTKDRYIMVQKMNKHIHYCFIKVRNQTDIIRKLATKLL